MEGNDETHDEEQTTSKIAFVPLKYSCSTCNEGFNKRRDYQVHIKLAHLPDDAEIFTCNLCKDTYFVSEMELALHNNLYHPVDSSHKGFECPICSKVYTTKTLLSRHFSIHSSATDRPHICEICGKSFFHYSSILAHAKMHSDIRDHACPQCGKAFRSQSHLTRHLKTHKPGSKTHECLDCGVRFAERYNLTAHIKTTHQGITRKKRSNITQVSSE